MTAGTRCRRFLWDYGNKYTGFVVFLFLLYSYVRAAARARVHPATIAHVLGICGVTHMQIADAESFHPFILELIAQVAREISQKQ